MAAALAVYVLWVLATYALEGMPRTFARPEAAGLRLAYTLVANLLVGTAGSLLVLRRLARRGRVDLRCAGFGAGRRTAISVLVGTALGSAVYAVQGPPPVHPMVVVNVLAQVLPVSMAEVLVCWSLLGVAAGAGMPVRAGGRLRSVVTVLVGSVAFGVYHIAHSPPFNSGRMIALLAVVGVATGACSVTLRDVYGTVAFHNALALVGVVRALAAADALAAYERLSVPLLATAGAALGLLVVVHVTLFGRRPRSGATDPPPAWRPTP